MTLALVIVEYLKRQNNNIKVLMCLALGTDTMI